MYLSISWLKSFGNCSNIWLRHDLKPSVFPFGLTSQLITILQAHHWWADGLLVFLSSEYFLAIPISMFSSYLFTLLKPSRAWFYTFDFYFLKNKADGCGRWFRTLTPKKAPYYKLYEPYTWSNWSYTGNILNRYWRIYLSQSPVYGHSIIADRPFWAALQRSTSRVTQETGPDIVIFGWTLFLLTISIWKRRKKNWVKIKRSIISL